MDDGCVPASAEAAGVMNVTNVARSAHTTPDAPLCGCRSGARFCAITIP